MKQDETRGMSDGEGELCADAEEVRQRVVRAFTQIVGDAMSSDWTRESLELTQGGVADETQGQPEDPARDGPDFFPLPPPRRYLRGTADEVPGTFSPSLEQASATSPYRYRRWVIQPSLWEVVPQAMPRPLLSPRVRKMIAELYGSGVPSPLGTDY